MIKGLEALTTGIMIKSTNSGRMISVITCELIDSGILFVNRKCFNHAIHSQETRNCYRVLYITLLMLSRISIDLFANLQLTWILELRRNFHILSVKILLLSTESKWYREKLDHWQIQKEGRIAVDGPLLFLYLANNTYFKEIKLCKNLQQQKLLSSSITISIDFVNYLKPRHAELLKYIFKL